MEIKKSVSNPFKYYTLYNIYMDIPKIFKTPIYQRKASLAWARRNRSLVNEKRNIKYCKKKVIRVLERFSSDYTKLDIIDLINIKNFIKYKNDNDIKVLLETYLPQDILVSIDEICSDFLLGDNIESD
jgi:hypothetical protein